MARFVSTQAAVVELPLVVSHLPERGGDVAAGALGTQAGTGFDIVCTVARQGVPTFLASPLGTGPNSAQVKVALAREGVRSLVSDIAGDNGLRMTMLEPDGTRTTVTSPGVEVEFSASELAGIALESGDWIYVSGTDLAYQSSSEVLSEWLAGLPPTVNVALGAGALIDEVPEELLLQVLGRADFVSMNHREAHILRAELGSGPVGEVLRRYLRPSAILVHRDGSRGCTVQANARTMPCGVSAFPAERVDTTGVGEAHIGVMIAGIMQGLELTEAARRGNAAAAVAISRHGSGTCPTAAEIDQFLASR